MRIVIHSHLSLSVTIIIIFVFRVTVKYGFLCRITESSRNIRNIEFFKLNSRRVFILVRTVSTFLGKANTLASSKLD